MSDTAEQVAGDTAAKRVGGAALGAAGGEAQAAAGGESPGSAGGAAPGPLDDATIRQVRSFNRSVTQRIGALNDEYLARGRPLGASRVLWEIGADGTDLRTLRARLDLDSGYLSRLVQTLERDGLVAVQPGADDKRVRTVRLTDAGRTERDLLDRQSDELAGSLLVSLSPRQRERLVEAMGVVERLLTAGLVSVDVEDPASPTARFCIESYFA